MRYERETFSTNFSNNISYQLNTGHLVYAIQSKNDPQIQRYWKTRKRLSKKEIELISEPFITKEDAEQIIDTSSLYYN